MDRAAPFNRIVAGVTPHFVTRQIFAGAGKVGAETATHDGTARRLPALPTGRVLRGAGRPGDHPQAADRQHPRRAARRSPALPAAARHRGRRQPGRGGHLLEGGHHVAGAGHDRGRRLGQPEPGPGRPGDGPCTRSPLDRTFTRPLLMADGSTATALAIQWELFSPGPQVRRRPGPGVLGDEDGRARRCCDRWEQVLHGLETDPMSLARQLDWVAKLQLIEAYRDRHGCDWDDHRLAALDLQYHDLRPATVAVRPAGHRAAGGRGLGGDRRHRAPPEDPGLVPGRVPQAVAGGGGHRQLGFPGVRPRHRPPAARPYDGSSEGHGRACRRICWQSCASPSELLDRLSS